MEKIKYNFDHDLSEEFFQMLRKVKPNGDSSYSFKWDYLMSSLMSKHPGSGGTDKDRYNAAIKKLLAANDACGYINRMGYADNSYSMKCILARAASICDNTLGEFSWDVIKGARFTSGSTTSRDKKRGDPYYKYHSSQPLHVTPTCANLAKALIMTTPVWAKMGALDNIKYVTGGTVITVPKNADTDRAIEQQPDLNACIQKGLGLSLDARLYRVGINLHDQSTNQALAWIGSYDGSLATIDLRGASDHVSLRLLRDLFPSIWCEILELCRVPSGIVEYDGTTSTVTWEMYATMGNGTTFGVETLIFYSLAKAVMEEAGISPVVGTNFAIYGDDIIVPSECANRLIWVLSALGFTTNKDKTFTEGPFRESCGEHYYAGHNVTPFYIREPIRDLTRVVWFLNSLRRWAWDDELQICDPTVYTVWMKIRRKYVPSDLLGGWNIEDITSVYSRPCEGKRIQFRSVSYNIDNWRAYLRWFQYQSEVTDVRYATLGGERQALPYVCGEPQMITRVLPDKVYFDKKETRYDLRREHLFPQEVLCVA